ncbi:hypothetical protein RhiirC2_716142 [Rhizophagus irregularis]|uniref:FAD dependent oxidoreductase domain-containing protein n=1 Tax=Rhizophagus irregularis TaxID=588596 RepID=A0A2N1MSK2_9GLOM|nr:hypothetical protein RhiirC2_716142 [Rhizophagus irregularis]
MVNKRVVEVGAGVSGLSTATLLLQQEKEIKVHLVAKHFPEDLSGEYTSPWYVVTYWNSLKFRNLNKEELPTGIECGVTYKTDNLTPYLNYLLNTFISLGGTTQHVSLSHLNECIESDTDVVINCSGIHAGTLGCVEDPEVYPARASEKFDKKILICHNYGHGGAGFQSSYGTAKHVIEIMESNKC